MVTIDSVACRALRLAADRCSEMLLLLLLLVVRSCSDDIIIM